MSASVIPKEKLTAYQRWEMASFDPPPPSPSDAPPGPDPALLEEAVRQREAARAEGHAEGYAAGHPAGFDAGQAAGQAAVQAEAARLAGLAEAFTQALQAAERDIAGHLLMLALDIARQALRQTLAVRPEALLPAVREVLAAELLNGSPRLLLHPDDIALVQDHLQDELLAAGWTIRADATIARGGCRAQAASGEIDATLPTRWERVAAALGRTVSW